MAKSNKLSGTEDASRHDRNDVVLRGVLTTAPEHRVFGSGASLARLLVTIRLSAPRTRTDVIPVTVWEPEAAVIEAERGTPVDVIGQVHRRFWTDAEGRHSRVEVVATELVLGEIEPTG